MKVIALGAAASFLVVGTVVGIRMLLLARRTRSLPELLLGAGLTSLTAVTLPAMGLSLGAKLGSTSVQAAVFGLGLVPVVGFAMCLYAFTARVFRPGRPWASGAIWMAGAAAGIGVAGTISARVAAWDADKVVGAEWSVLLIGTFLVGMTWTGVESLLYYVRLRRRLALGMIDPVVCERFLLWAIGNLGAVAGTAVVVASLCVGWRVVSHPVPILGIAAAGLTLSASWYLAFLPPAAYLKRIRLRVSA